MKDSIQILIVDDQINTCKSLQAILKKSGYRSEYTLSAEEALGRVRGGAFDIVISDIRMPGMDGMQLLEELKKIQPYLVVIMVTGFATIKSAVDAIQKGAYDYLPKPFTPDEVRVIIQRAAEKIRLESENDALRRGLQPQVTFQNIIGNSPALQRVFDMIQKVADTDSNILITGETGTGKELAAKAIHNLSRRRGKAFQPINCGSLAEGILESELFGHVKGAFTGAVATRKGLIEVADGGTIFLDEVAETTPAFQIKILRVLQEGEFLRVGDTQPIHVDLRIIAATNRDLEKAVERREFRQDLYYRLKGIAIHLPPLRERTEDLPLLAYHFLKKYRGNRKAELLDPQAIKALLAYKWPGNIRELEHVIEYALSMTAGDTIRVTDLPEEFLARVADKVTVQDNWMSSPFGKAKEEFEKFYISHILEESDWNVSEASRKAQMFRQNLQQKIRKYGLRPEGEEESKEEGE
ncbi:MAG: sigma-54-dependent Fis family transcriptional regulator [Deltaproteobacteria bacterium]|nr:MAG: sigma-54-dependent Fis family transcriptional regulator [Deltaproteobacteria bacterium]